MPCADNFWEYKGFSFSDQIFLIFVSFNKTM